MNIIEFLGLHGYFISFKNGKWIYEVDQDDTGELTKSFDTVVECVKYALTDINISNLL